MLQFTEKRMDPLRVFNLLESCTLPRQPRGLLRGSNDSNLGVSGGGRNWSGSEGSRGRNERRWAGSCLARPRPSPGAPRLWDTQWRPHPQAPRHPRGGRGTLVWPRGSQRNPSGAPWRPTLWPRPKGRFCLVARHLYGRLPDALKAHSPAPWPFPGAPLNRLSIDRPSRSPSAAPPHRRGGVPGHRRAKAALVA